MRSAMAAARKAGRLDRSKGDLTTLRIDNRLAEAIGGPEMLDRDRRLASYIASQGRPSDIIRKCEEARKQQREDEEQYRKATRFLKRRGLLKGE